MFGGDCNLWSVRRLATPLFCLPQHGSQKTADTVTVTSGPQFSLSVLGFFRVKSRHCLYDQPLHDAYIQKVVVDNPQIHASWAVLASLRRHLNNITVKIVVARLFRNDGVTISTRLPYREVEGNAIFEISMPHQSIFFTYLFICIDELIAG